MPALNKQTLINLLIDSPLREPIKINLVDIVNNTNDADLPKVYPTIVKELEIFQKATERRLKLADETITKLQGNTENTSTPSSPTPPAETPPSTVKDPVGSDKYPTGTPPLSVPPLDLPPLPTQTNTAEETLSDAPPELIPTPSPQPNASPTNINADEDALKEIQKELDNLKVSATTDSNAPPSPSSTPPDNPTETT